MFILGIFAIYITLSLLFQGIDDQYCSFRYFLPERLVGFMVNKLDLTYYHTLFF